MIQKEQITKEAKECRRSASWRGVSPSLSFKFMSHPSRINSCAIFMFCSLTATWSGDCWLALRAFMLHRFLARTWATLVQLHFKIHHKLAIKMTQKISVWTQRKITHKRYLYLGMVIDHSDMQRSKSIFFLDIYDRVNLFRMKSFSSRGHAVCRPVGPSVGQMVVGNFYEIQSLFVFLHCYSSLQGV